MYAVSPKPINVSPIALIRLTGRGWEKMRNPLNSRETRSVVTGENIQSINRNLSSKSFTIPTPGSKSPSPSDTKGMVGDSENTERPKPTRILIKIMVTADVGMALIMRELKTFTPLSRNKKSIQKICFLSNLYFSCFFLIPINSQSTKII